MATQWSLRKEKKKLEAMMASLDWKSPEYALLLETYEKLTRANANENSWKGPVLVQAIGQGVNACMNGIFGMMQIKHITKVEEDGHILNSKSMPFVRKPK